MTNLPGQNVVKHLFEIKRTFFTRLEDFELTVDNLWLKIDLVGVFWKLQWIKALKRYSVLIRLWRERYVSNEVVT